MATVGSTYLTLLDAAKRVNPDGTAAKIAEMLSLRNDVLQDIPWVEGNLPTGNQYTARTGMPTAYYRKLNQGVPNSKSTTAQITEACAMLQARSQVDEKLVRLQNDPAAFRLNEGRSFIEAMGQKFCSTLFYGSTIGEPESFLGLAPRFDDVPTTSGGAANKVNVIDAGGTGTDNTSIYLIGWSPDTVYGTYPKNSEAGLRHKDLGLQTIADSVGRYETLEEKYEWDVGLCVADWRYIVRIANIDVSDLIKTAASGADLTDLMTRAKYRLQSFTGVQPRWYVNRTVASFLERQITNKVASSTLNMSQIGDSEVMTFSRAPVRVCDALLDTEARVT